MRELPRRREQLQEYHKLVNQHDFSLIENYQNNERRSNELKKQIADLKDEIAKMEKRLKTFDYDVPQEPDPQFEMLEQLGLPVSFEQKQALRKLENEYLEQNIIPSLEQLLQSEVETLHSSFNLLVTYTPDDGLSIKPIEKKTIKQPALFDIEESATHHGKQGYLRVTFPDGRVVQESVVLKTLIEVVEFAGPRRVQALNIRCGNENLIRDGIAQDEKRPLPLKQLSTGQVIQTNSSTRTKLEQIEYINQQLNLGLVVEHIR